MKKLLFPSVLARNAAPVLASVLAIAPVLLPAAFVAASAPLATAQAAAPSDQITIKDPAEFNAYQNCTTQTTPQAKASACEAFLTQFPQSVVKKAVLDTLVDAYSQTDPVKTVDAAKRLLQVDPNNL